MIYTFLYGIDAIFRINKSLIFHTSFYFCSFIISIIGWYLLKSNKSLGKRCLGFIFVPAFPLFNTLFCFGSYLKEFHTRNFIIFGGLYFIIFVASLLYIIIKTNNNDWNKNWKQTIFIVLSGIMILTHCCIELITNFENFLNPTFFIFSIILIIYYYLRILIIRIYNCDPIKSKKLNLTSNILFWVYIVLYDFACFGIAAASV